MNQEFTTADIIQALRNDNSLHTVLAADLIERLDGALAEIENLVGEAAVARAIARNAREGK